MNTPAQMKKLRRMKASGAYLRAYEDVAFLRREDLRPVRLQLELLKPELMLREQGITSTVVVFGSTRTVSREEMAPQIARLEKKLEELEATEVAFQRTSCRSANAYGPDHSDCVSSSFHRDAEIARTQESLEEAQQKLADLEQRARSASEDQNCSPAAASE